MDVKRNGQGTLNSPGYKDRRPGDREHARGQTITYLPSMAAKSKGKETRNILFPRRVNVLDWHAARRAQGVTTRHSCLDPGSSSDTPTRYERLDYPRRAYAKKNDNWETHREGYHSVDFKFMMAKRPSTLASPPAQQEGSPSPTTSGLRGFRRDPQEIDIGSR